MARKKKRILSSIQISRQNTFVHRRSSYVEIEEVRLLETNLFEILPTIPLKSLSGMNF